MIDFNFSDGLISIKLPRLTWDGDAISIIDTDFPVEICIRDSQRRSPLQIYGTLVLRQSAYTVRFA